ncbi:MAG: hypothetical protein L3J95_00410 [Thermoplasmata archaeon]|nr:hypothetical protein [Thermoplasmata archaeon]MCI4358883.1 hypothetical protein [Thermoplasmata archaeon]
MSIAPGDVPSFLVLEPRGGIRLDIRLPTPACQIDAALQNPIPGRSFILMVGEPSEPFVQRARIAGKARLHFEPGSPGLYVILLTNPMREPAVVRLKLRPLVVEIRARKNGRRTRSKTRSRPSVS